MAGWLKSGAVRRMAGRAAAVGSIGMLGLGGAAWAQNSVTVFGGADAGLRHVNNSAGSRNSMQSGNNYTSRIGLRGVEDLGGGLQASFWLESTVGVPTGAAGSGSTFWDRRATLSLSGKFGELRMGRDYTPMFRAFAGTDVFGYVGVAGMGTVFSADASGPVGGAFGTGATTVARANGSFQYYTPNTLGGFYFNGMYAREGGMGPGGFDFWGARAGYASGPLDASLFGGATKIDKTGQNFRLYGAAVNYTMGNVKLLTSAVQMKYQRAEQTNYSLGVEWKVGPGQILASYRRVNQSGTNAAGVGIDGNDANVFGLGYVHNLSKRTALYGTAAYVNNKGGARFVLPGGQPGHAAGTSSRGAEIGIRHIF